MLIQVAHSFVLHLEATMFIYLFYNDLFKGEVRKVVTSFPLNGEQINAMRYLMDTEMNWRYRGELV